MLFLAILSGVFFAVQGPVNTALGKRISVFQASFVSFLGGTLVSGLLVLLIGQGDFSKFSQLKLWQVIGGLYGLVNVCVTILVIPVLGAALTLTTIMLGQLLAGAVIDRFGFLGSAVIEVSFWRFAGIAVVAAGIVLIYFGSLNREAKNKDKESRNFKKILMLFLSVIAGILGAMQSPTNASMAGVIGSWEGTFVSFVVGTVALIPVTLVANKGKIRSVRGSGVKPWMIIGGLYGVGGIFLSLYTVSKLGTALQVACGMIGQLSSGLILDTFGLIQTTKVKINVLRILGIALIIAGVILVQK